MRKRRAEKRYLKPDPKFNSVSVAKFINAIMYDGKKSVARRVLYNAFEIIEDRTKKPGLEIFNKAIANTE
ncbi:MAG: 30S ribosomal protein S7, partial [Ignavibacteriaceae bacterium]